MAGYSGTPLVKKLGIKSAMRVVCLNAPDGYAATLGDLPDAAELVDTLDADHGNPMIQFFTSQRDDLEREFPTLKTALASDGTLWISWPKKASGVSTNLNENIVREIGLKNGLVDVKICAIDEVWSGLKFVYRIADRT